MAIWPFSLFSRSGDGSDDKDGASLQETADRKRLELLKERSLGLRTEMAKAAPAHVTVTPDMTNDRCTFLATVAFVPRTLRGNRKYGEAEARQGQARQLFVASIDYRSDKPFIIAEFFPQRMEKHYRIGEYGLFKAHVLGILETCKDEAAA